MTRFHGVFASNSKHRVLVTPAGRGKGGKKFSTRVDDYSFAERHAATTWAQRLKRVFNSDITTCKRCQGQVRIIACIEDPAAIRQILPHLKSKEATDQQARPSPGRALPQLGLFEA